MSKKEQKIKAQDLIMSYLAGIGYCSSYEEFCENFDTQEEADLMMKSQMDRVAKMFGYKESWFY